MANTLGSVEIDLIARVGKLEADMAKAQRTVQSKTSKMADDAKRNMKAIGAAFVAAGGAAAAFAIKQIDVVDSMAKAARAAGLSAEALQELRFAGDRSGVSIKQVDEGMRRFNRRLGLFIQDGGGPAAKAFEQLGINALDAEGKVKSTEQVFQEVVTALGRFESQAELAAVASQLFGDDAGPKLALLLAEGADGIASLREEARRYGIVTNESAAASEKAADALTNVKQILSGAFSRAVADNAVQIARLAEGFAEMTLTALEFWGIIRNSDEIRQNFDRITNSIDEQQRVLEQLTRQYGANSDAAENVRRRIADLNVERGAEIRKLREMGVDISELSRNRSEEVAALIRSTAAVDEHTDAQDNLARTLPEVEGMVELATQAVGAHTESQERVKAVIEEVVVTAERKAGPALQGLLDDFDKTATGADNTANDVEDLRITVQELAETQAPLEGWADALLAAFGNIEGGAGDVVRGIAGVIGTVNQLSATAARQGGTLTLAQQLQGGAQLGGFASQAFGIQGPSGQTGAAIGSALGYVGGAAVGAGMTGVLGAAAGPIGALIGAAIGGLLSEDDGETNPRIAITNNRLYEELDRGDPEGIAARYLSPFSRRSALGVTIQGQQITEALGGARAQEILDTIQQFDQLIADVVRSSGLGDMDAIKNALLGPTGDSTRVYEEGFTTQQILADRFNTVLQGFDETVRDLVGTVTDADDGMRRLGAAVTLITELNEGPIQQFEDALQRANMTTIEVLDEQSQALRDQAAEYAGTTAELERLAAGTQVFNQAVVATLLSIEQASRAVDQITTSTRDSIAFRQLGIDGGPNAQVGFLLQRARQLQGEIGGLGSAEAVQSQVQLINNLINQALGLVSDEDFARIADKVTPILDATEQAAQSRLDSIKTGVESIAEATTEAITGISDTITPAAATISTAADTQSSAADRMLSGAELFAQNVVDFGGYVRNLPNTIQIVIPGVGEVNAA